MARTKKQKAENQEELELAVEPQENLETENTQPSEKVEQPEQAETVENQEEQEVQETKEEEKPAKKSSKSSSKKKSKKQDTLPEQTEVQPAEQSEAQSAEEKVEEKTEEIIEEAPAENIPDAADEQIAEQPEQPEQPVEQTDQIEKESEQPAEPVEPAESIEQEPEQPVEKTPVKNKRKIRPSFQELFEKMQSNLPLMICTCIFSFILMALVALVVFFATVEGPEKVMVPNVIGKKLEEGLLEMQVKELYPKISLRYSDTPGNEGQILDQSPEAGAIVKGYSRVSLVVSRGVIVDSVDNYIGQNLDELKMKLQTLFAGSTRPLIVIGDVSYKPDATDAGTILEQDPPEGTSITDPVTVNLVVSRGPNYDNTKPPYLIGKSVNDVLQTITRSKLIFDFTYHIAYDDEVPGTVTEQQKFDTEYVPNYTHMSVEMALPAESDDGNVYGIFDTEIDALPYAVSMRLEAVPPEGDAYTIISFTHNGGSLTLPYAVPSGTKLLLYVDNKVRAEETVD